MNSCFFLPSFFCTLQARIESVRFLCFVLSNSIETQLDLQLLCAFVSPSVGFFPPSIFPPSCQSHCETRQLAHNKGTASACWCKRGALCSLCFPNAAVSVNRKCCSRSRLDHRGSASLLDLQRLNCAHIRSLPLPPTSTPTPIQVLLQ